MRPANFLVCDSFIWKVVKLCGMNNLTQRLRNPLSKVQKSIAKCYLRLHKHFEENSIISESWAAMGGDLRAHADSLRKLPPTFWQSLRHVEKDLVATLKSVQNSHSNALSGTLHSCLTQAVDIEEPLILKVYAPLIRQLRIAWTDRATDFYVMVSAHLARLARLIRLYSGDPVLGQKCDSLLQDFEKEVQYPPSIPGKEERTSKKRIMAGKRKGRLTKSRPLRARAPKQKARSRVKLTKRAKPLIKKIEITRRRAQRR